MQPLLLMFPLGLFTMAIIFDVATLAGAPRLLGTVAYWTIIAGLLGGAVAVGIISVDVMATRPVGAARLGTFGVLLDLGVLIVFTVIVLTRLRTEYRGTDSGLLLVEALALTVAGISTWFGGRLGPHSLVPRRTVLQTASHRASAE
ncbi:DUF2231 domain-containing protein [Actinoplanes sp. CA-051413]|uniref:DUF2231 domain-containing protein n=1 Tax=Actinoplanes sp. CA-051413 TaxID=3239899 RepID=UPI003D98F36B